MRKKKVKWKEKALADLYKVSVSLFSNCYFVHDCYVSNLFPCSSGDSFSSLPIEAVILVDQDRKTYMLLWQSIYIYILSLFLFRFVYIKTYTSFFNVNENKKKRNDNYSFSFLNNYTRQICIFVFPFFFV